MVGEDDSEIVGETGGGGGGNNGGEICGSGSGGRINGCSGKIGGEIVGGDYAREMGGSG